MLTRNEIDQIKRLHPLVPEVERYGIDLRPSGRTLVGRCPFHADHRHPNFTVYPEADAARDHYFCFACGAFGDVIRFVRGVDGVGFTQAVQRLDGAAIPRLVRPASRLRQLPASRPRTVLERACLMAAVDLYRNQLASSTGAQQYLAGRGIDTATAERCRVGYAAGDELLPYLRWRHLPAASARRVGLLDRNGRETMAGRIVVPEFRNGRAVWLVGRAIQEGQEPRYRGLPGRKPLLGWEAVACEPAVIVVEGVTDWLTLRRWGLPAVALGGTYASARALGALRQFDRVYVVLNSDTAGQDGARRLTGFLGERAVPVAIPLGLNDVNDVGRRPDGQRLLLAMFEGAQRAHSHLERPGVAA